MLVMASELALGIWGRHREGILGRGEGPSRGSEGWAAGTPEQAKPENAPLLISVTPTP